MRSRKIIYWIYIWDFFIWLSYLQRCIVLLRQELPRRQIARVYIRQKRRTTSKTAAEAPMRATMAETHFRRDAHLNQPSCWAIAALLGIINVAPTLVVVAFGALSRRVRKTRFKTTWGDYYSEFSDRSLFLGLSALWLHLSRGARGSFDIVNVLLTYLHEEDSIDDVQHIQHAAHRRWLNLNGR